MPKQTNKYPGVKEIIKNVLYEVYGEAGNKSDGSRDRFKERFHGTIKEAVKYREQLRAEIDQGNFLKPAKQTVGEYLHWWLDHLNDNREEPYSDQTIQSYRARIDTHLIPAMGGIPLDKLNVIHIQNYIKQAREKGQAPRKKKFKEGEKPEFKPFSKRTIDYTLIVLRMALKSAVKPYKLIKENPAEDIEISAQTKRKKVVLTPDQMKQVFECLELTDRRISVYALFTGVRRGEALGALWSRINLDISAAVKVDRSLRRVKGQGIKPKPVKTDASNRPIDLAGTIVAMLKEIRKEQVTTKLNLGPDYQDDRQGTIDVNGPLVTWVDGDKFAPYLVGKEIKINEQIHTIASVESPTDLTLGHSAGVHDKIPYLVDDLDLVFCQFNGKPIDPDLVSKHFKKAVRKAGFPNMRFHDLRHNFASWMLADAELLHVVQELLGHELASTTQDTYGEAMPGSHKAAVDRFDQKYGPLINGK